MKTSTILLVIVGLLVLFGATSGCSNYKSFGVGRESVRKSWSNVEVTYQRRADLIPNLVSTVKGYASHEATTLENVIKQRAAATKPEFNINVADGENFSPEKVKAFMANQSEISSALSRLMVVQEQYPELKADKQFIALMDELAGTESRIGVARQAYNDRAESYNVKFTSVTGGVWGGLFGFKKFPYFKAEEGSQKAPEVKFG